MEKEGYFMEDVDRMFKEGVTVVIFAWPVIKLVLQNGWVGKIQKKIRKDPEAREFNVLSEFNKTEKEIVFDFIDDLTAYFLSNQGCKRMYVLL